jgi:hypothetical protein
MFNLCNNTSNGGRVKTAFAKMNRNVTHFSLLTTLGLHLGLS